jgi:hypothetical protein
MRRRELFAVPALVTGLGKEVARAQQPKLLRVGWLSLTTPAGNTDLLRGVTDAFAAEGYVPEQTFRIEQRYARGDMEALPAFA